MSEQAAQPTPEAAPLGLMSRFVGIVTSPKETFTGLVARPRWIGVLLLIAAVMACGSIWFSNSEAGRIATSDYSVSKAESFAQMFGADLPDRVRDDIAARPMNTPLWQIVLQSVLGIPAYLLVSSLFWSGLLFLAFNVAGGGGRSFKQVLSIVAHGHVITLVQQLFVLPVGYLSESLDSKTNLGVLLPMLPDGSFLANFFGWIDLFWVWWMLVLAIGLAVLYRRKTRPIALSFFAIYGVIALAVAAFQAMRSGS